MSYRPKVKTDSSGTLVDLAIDATTINGKSVTTTSPTTTSTDNEVPTSKAVWSAIPKTTEVWIFTLEDDTTVQKEIYIK